MVRTLADQGSGPGFNFWQQPVCTVHSSGFEKKVIIIISYMFFNISKCRQFEGLSTDMFILTNT